MYSVSADTSPDVSHKNQMTTIYRYVDETEEPRERLYLNPNLGDFGEGKGGVRRVSPPILLVFL